MFNICDWLVNGLEALEVRCAGNRQLIELGLAQGFITVVLGETWYERAIKLGSDPDPWMLNGDDAWLAANPVADDVRRFAWAFRVVRLADALFTGRKAAGFDNLLRRFQARPDTQASFMEAEIASMLVHNGCSVSIVAESGVRGQDFDILCEAEGAKVSVEVTAVCSNEPSVSSVRNKLYNKRNQVPRHRPAVLYVRVPATWMRDAAVAAPVRLFSDCGV